MRFLKGFIIALCPLFFMPDMTGQKSITGQALDNFDEYFRRQVREKIYLNTDRSVYLPGETIWLKVYSLDSRTNAPVSLSRVVYVELMTNTGTTVTNLLVELSDASGSGYIRLPQDLVTGYYYIRAYTHWMRNLAPENYFMQKLAIIDPYNRLYEFTDSLALINTEELKCIFYPEGGKLISNIESVVCAKLTDLNGTPLSREGFLIDETDSVFSSLFFDMNGLARVTLKPLPAKRYRIALGDTSGLTDTFPLPEADSTGMILQYLSAGNNRFNFQVAGRQEGTWKKVWIGVVSEDGLTWYGEISTGSLPFPVNIPVNQLGRNINLVFIAAQDGTILSERLLYNPVEELSITVRTPKTEFNNREKVIVEILTENPEGQPVQASLSVSVPVSEASGLLDAPDMYSYNSVISGIASDRILNVGELDPGPGSPLDLMLLSGKIKIPVSEIVDGLIPDIDYYPELEGVTVSGTVINPSTGMAVKDVMVYLSVVGREAAVTCRKTDINGTFYFSLKKAYGDKDIVLQLRENADNYLIRLDENFSTDFVKLPKEPLVLDDSWKSFIEDQMVVAQVMDLYGRKTGVEEKVPGMRDFYIRPDVLVNMEEFIRLPLMKEVFRELVKRTMITREQGMDKIGVVDLHYNRIIGDDPLLLIDGVPVFDHETVLNINPEELATIETVSYKYFRNLMEMDGIINIKTNTGDLSLPDMPEDWVRQYYQGLQIPLRFDHKQYDDPEVLESRIPDFRSQLYWEPSLSTGKDGKAKIEFYTSDLNASYDIIIQGITRDGLSGSVKTTIKVGN